MDNRHSGKSDWQAALEHHKDLRTERCNNLDRRFDAVDRRLDNIEAEIRELRREMYAGQRWIIGLILAGYFVWPTALIVLLKFS